MLTHAEIIRESSALGFRPEPFEKAIHVLELLDALCRHPFLKERVVLKGGTALNAFLFDLPRLSVDVDLNYVGAADRQVMLDERPTVEQAIEAVCGRLGIQIRRVPTEHAGGKWRLSYTSASGRPSTMELDLNFMYRSPLWPPVLMTSQSIASYAAGGVPVLDLHELAAGKLCALFDRNASRDVFDVHRLLGSSEFDRDRLRLACVVYGGGSRRDWRTVSGDDITLDPEEAERQLIPMLRSEIVPPSEDRSQWGNELVDECRRLVQAVLPLEEHELEFLTRLNDRGEIAPHLLTSDETMRNLIRSQPTLHWKAENVRQHTQGSE
jgi:predicted nucleotidyltransferase component of viral defense system